MTKGDMIKRPNTLSEYTPDQILEMKKCASDPIYFAKNYIRVQHPKHGSVPFDPYEYQERCINAFKNNRWTIVLARKTITASVYNQKQS